MFAVNLRSYFRAVRNSLIPDDYPRQTEFRDDGTIVTPGFSVSFDLTVRSRKDIDKRSETSVYLILCKNTTVMFAEGDRYPAPQLSEYRNISNHDSCWIDSIQQEFTGIYFRMCREVDDSVAPIELDDNCSHRISGDPRPVKVVLKCVPEKDYGSIYEVVGFDNIKPW